MPYWIFLTKNVLFEYFWARIFEKYFHILNKHTQNCLLPKIPYLGIFGLQSENNIIIFEISTVEFI